MSGHFETRFHALLSPPEAERLVTKLNGFVDSFAGESGGMSAHSPDEIDDLSTRPMRELRFEGEEDREGLSDVVILLDKPPALRDAQQRGDLKAPVLERFRECHSTVLLEYDAYTAFNVPAFKKLQHLVLDEIGQAVVETCMAGEQPSTFALSEDFAKEVGWKLKRATKKTTVRQHEAQPGEREAIKLCVALERAAKDPFLRDRIRAALGPPTETMHTYARFLLEDGLTGDARAAKSLGRPTKDITGAREELASIFRKFKTESV